MFKTVLCVCVAFTVLSFLVAFYKNFKLRPYKKRMKHAKELMRDSKTWIEESERGMRLYEDENKTLAKQKKSM